MRDIKFRVWNTETNKMITNVKEMGVFALQSIYSIDEFLVIPTNEKYPLMQYTGLKDKNGVEIYEGDIVKTTSNKLAGKWKHKIYKIEFKEIICLAGAKYMGFDFQFNVDEVEVIGNIYENKELLND